jgi:hypothetical protein
VDTQHSAKKLRLFDDRNHLGAPVKAGGKACKRKRVRVDLEAERCSREFVAVGFDVSIARRIKFASSSAEISAGSE